jgi:hypothetical protein
VRDKKATAERSSKARPSKARKFDELSTPANADADDAAGKREVDGDAEEGRDDQKRKKTERKSQKPNADLIAEAKQLWETARLNNTVAEQKSALEKLHALTKTKVRCCTRVSVGLLSTARQVAELIHKHDASRIIETLLKHGSHAVVRALTLPLCTADACLRLCSEPISARSCAARWSSWRCRPTVRDRARRRAVARSRSRVNRSFHCTKAAEVRHESTA